VRQVNGASSGLGKGKKMEHIEGRKRDQRSRPLGSRTLSKCALATVIAIMGVSMGNAGDVSEVTNPCQANQVVTIWPKDAKEIEVIPDPVYAFPGDVVRFQNLTEEDMVVSFLDEAGKPLSPFESAVVFVVPSKGAVCWTVSSTLDMKDKDGNPTDKSFGYTVEGEQVTARPRIIVKPSSS
jgi:hypothetical protein